MNYQKPYIKLIFPTSVISKFDRMYDLNLHCDLTMYSVSVSLVRCTPALTFTCLLGVTSKKVGAASSPISLRVTVLNGFCVTCTRASNQNSN